MSRGLTKGFLSIINAKILRSAIGILSLPVVVRLLGPDSYGDYAFLMSIFSLLMIIISSGVTDGVQKFVAENRNIDSWQDYVVGFYLKLAVALAVVGSGVLAIATWGGAIEYFVGPQLDLYFYILSLFVITAQFRAFTRRSLMGFGLEFYSESLYLAQKVISVTLGLSLIWLGFGVAGFLSAHVLAAGIVATIGFGLLSRRVSLIQGLRGQVPISSTELLRFNLYNIVLVLILMSLFHIDIVFLRLLVGSEQTGYYKAALSLAEYMWLVPIALETLLLHSTSPLWSKGELQRITELSARITRYTFLLTSLLAIGVFTLADSFVPLYFGQEFTPVIRPLIYLLPGAFGFALARPLFAINQSKGNLKPLIVAVGVAALLNAVLNLFLIPIYGMTGAAIATSIGYGSMVVLQIGCARYFGVNPLDDIRGAQLLIVAGASTPIILGTDTLLKSNLLSLLLVPPIGFFAFSAIALKVRAIHVDEVVSIISSFPDPIGKTLRAAIPDSWKSG